MVPSTANLDWLYHLLGYLLAAAGLTLLLWALFWDRSRGRRRCPKCWYDMSGVPGLTCPECGREPATEQSFFRTRRRKRLAALAVLIALAGYAVVSVPELRKFGWPSLFPSGVLVFLAPARPPLPSTTAPTPGRTLGEILTEETWLRYRRGQLAKWQSRAFLHRLLRPLADAEANTLVREALAPYLAIDNGRTVLLILDRESIAPWTSIDFGVAFSYEIRVDGAIVDSGSGTSQWLLPNSRAVFAAPDDKPWQLREVDQRVRQTHATITIRGDRLASAADYIIWSTDRRAACWAGEFTVLLEFREYPGSKK